MKRDSNEQVKPKQKRFKHQSYQAAVKEVHLPSPLARNVVDLDIPDDESHFRVAIDDWRQSNLSPTFLKFASKAEPLAMSMALLLHNAPELVGLWIEAAGEPDDEALQPLLDLLQKLLHDLRSTLAPQYEQLLAVLLPLSAKSLAPEVLPVYLQTMSTLFKYLLLPQPDRLPPTWSSVQSTLRSCTPEMQRMFGEVVGTTIRKLKSEDRLQMVQLLVDERDDLENAITWTFISATQSVSNTLHTTTPSFVTALLDRHLALEPLERTFKLLQRVLSSAMHHSTIESFAPVAEAVVLKLEEIKAAGHEEQLARTLEAVCIVCAFRKGKKAESMLGGKSKQTAAILNVVTTTPLSSRLREPVLHATVACLKGYDMAIWMKGRRAIEHIWEDVLLGYSLAAVLSSLDQSKGTTWKDFILPFILRSVPAQFKMIPKETLALLRSLSSGNRLTATDTKWKHEVGDLIREYLSAWALHEEWIITLQDVFPLVTVFPGLEQSLITIIETIFLAQLDVQATQEEYLRTVANSAWCLGECLVALSTVEKGWKKAQYVDRWIRLGLERYPWNAKVVGGLAALAESSTQPFAFNDAFGLLKAAILSYSHTLRLAALHFLASPAVERTSAQDSATRVCLQAEEVPLTAQSIPKRVLKTSRVGTVCPLGEGSTATGVCVSWLTAQLKVNLMPVWKPAAAAVAGIAQRTGGGEEVWPVIFSELGPVSRGECSSGEVAVPSWSNSLQKKNVEDDKWKEEKTWRNLGYEGSCRLLRLEGLPSGVKQLVETQSTSERLDILNYETQLIRTLESCPSLAERHNRDLVPLFLAFASPDVPQRPQRQRLVSWLSLFAKFRNPKTVHSTSVLQRIYTSLISHPDRQLQSLAVDCTLTYKSRALLAHEKMIRSLLDHTEWKDHVVSLKLAETVQPDERAEVVELLIRLFFGMMRERKGRNQIHGKRGALLKVLGQCSDQELGVLVDLMVEPFKFSTTPDADIPSLALEVTDKQQTGFLVLLGDVLRFIGSNLVIWWPKLLKTTMAIVLNAQETLDKVMELDVENHEEEIAEPEGQDDLLENAPLPHKVARNIRQLGLKRLVEFFRMQVTFDFHPYLLAAFRGFISPRLPVLDRENTQAPSTLLELFHVWSSNPSMRLFLVDYDDRLLPKIYQCLTAPSVKRPVISRVFDIVEQVLDGATDSEEVASRVTKPHMALLLDNLTVMVENTARTGVVTSDLSQRQIRILSAVSSFVSDASQASRLVHLLSPLLRKPTRVVAEKVKVDLLDIIQQLLPLLPQMTDATDATSVKTYELFSYLFQTLRTRQSRLALVSAFSQLANYDSSLQGIAPLIESLNSYSERRHEEPDFERRLQAYASLNEQLYGRLSAREWLPLIYNMLFFVHEPEEVALRNNSAYTLRRFIDVVASGSSNNCEAVFNRVLWPGLKNGMRANNDMVRGEILGVLGYAVAHCDHLPSLRETSVLLANGDEEANFFNNVHHIQVHRRSRALRRLAEYCEQGRIRSGTLADIFLPLIGHFIGDTSIDHTLVNEAITTTGKIARQLAWGPYYALVQQYLRSAKEKNAKEKTYVRTVVSVLDNFHFAMDDIVQQPVEELGVNMEDESEAVPSISTRIADAVINRFLPSLLTYLEKRDETEDEIRIPVSIGVVRVALHLPEESRRPQVSRLLTIISQALRSKSQDTRNLVRETLCKIAVILGPDWLRPLIKELRLALTRGPQLHVLAYTCHSILVHVTSETSNAFAHLDEVAEDVAEASAEVIFGQSGRGAQGEDFKTKMTEVRGAASKALDSFALIAKHIAPRSITRLLIPLKSIMHETEILKVMNQVEDVLRRITTGLNSNPHLTPPELLVLCHSLISQNAKFLQEAPRVVEQYVKGGKKHFIVQAKRDLPTTCEHYAHNSFRFVAFGLDLVVTAFRRSKFDFRDEEIIARLEPIVPVIGNTLYSTAAPVVVLGLRAAAAILKAPLKAAGPAVPVVCSQCIQIVRQASGTESETAQAALKSLAIILRDCPMAELKERDLSFLLEVMSPDLEEPERQLAVFALLRALIARKFVVPEIYDMMEQVAGVMVTSQSPQVQELCRSVLLQFLLDYPQGKGRLRKQMSFLASNLSYGFETGRQSVMELLGAVLTKFDSNLIKEYGELFWMALIMVLANDDSAKCRERAAELIKSLYKVLGDTERRRLLDRTHIWAQQAEKIRDAPDGKEAMLARVAAQLYGLVAEAMEKDMRPHLAAVVEDLNSMAAVSSRLFTSIAEGEEESRMEEELEWRLGYHSLNVLSKLAKYFPELLSSSPDAEISIDWASVVRLMLFPHSWVRSASSRLLGSLYATLSITVSFSQDDSHPAAISGMVLVAQNSCAQLKSEHMDETLALQVVKNLAWLGRVFSVLSPRSILHPHDSSSEPEARAGEGDDNVDKHEDDERVGRLKRAELSPLPWLFSKLSYQIKTSLIQRRSSFSTRTNWYHQPSAILRWFATMVSHLDATLLERYLVHLLTPVYRIIDDDSIRDTHIDDIKVLAQELQDLVQTKIGTTSFAAAYNQIRQGALSIRRERKAARAILVTTNPEAAAMRQIQRNISKKDNRKRKSRALADARAQGSTFKRRKMG